MAKKTNGQTANPEEQKQVKADEPSNAAPDAPKEQGGIWVEVVLGEVWHSGEKYVVGDKVCMDPKDAKRLIDSGFTKEV